MEGVKEAVARDGDPWRQSGFSWFELQGHTVDAVPLTDRPGSVRKHVAKMGFTLCGREASSFARRDRALSVTLARGTPHGRPPHGRPALGFDIRMGRGGKLVTAEFD